MGRMTYECGITVSKDEAVFEMREDGKALGHMLFDASTLEGLIADLSKLRKNLTEQVTPELEPNSRVPVEHNPGWRVPADHGGSPNSLVLALRHPGIGWLGFQFDEERARELGKALSEIPAKR